MQKKDTKNILIESLKELSRVKAIDKISVRDISENCGVTTQTFYNHFRVKNELVFYTYKLRVDDLMYRFENGEITWKQALEIYLKGFRYQCNFILNALNNTSGPDSYMEQASAYLLEQMVKMLKHVKGTEDVPEKYIFQIKFYSYGLINMIAEWLREGMKISEKELVELFEFSEPRELQEYVFSKEDKQ